MKKLIFAIVLIFTPIYAIGQSVDEMILLDEEAAYLYNQADFQSAAEKWEQGLKKAKIINDKQLIAIFTANLGLVYWNIGDNVKALSYYEESLKITREIGDSNGEAGDLNKIGVIYADLGDNAKALSYYKEAHKINLKNGNRRGVGNNLYNIGSVYADLGNNEKALLYYNIALQIRREIGDRSSEGTNLSYIGNVYWQFCDYLKALFFYEEALKIYREIGDRRSEGNMLTNIGSVCADLGDYAKALFYGEEALKFHREIGDRKNESIDLMNIGSVYADLGDYAKALSYGEKALEIRREIGDISGNLINIGYVYGELGDYLKALSYYKEALKIDRELADKKGMGVDLYNIGIVYADLGDYAKAISYYEEALKIDREIGHPTERIEASIADIWLDMRKLKEAEAILFRLGSSIHLGRLNLIKHNYDKAIENYSKSLKNDLENRNAKFLFSDYLGLGKGYECLQDYRTSQEHYTNVINLIEEQREAMGEGERANFFGTQVWHFKRTEPYEGMVRVLGNQDNHNDAFYYGENLKARLLSETIAKGHLIEEHILPLTLEKEENVYITQIRGLRKQMEALYKNKAMDIYTEKEAELKEVKEKQQAFISKLRESYPEYAAVHYPQPIRPQEVILNQDEALLEFEVTDIATLVFLLQDGKLKTKRIEISRDSLQTLVKEYRGYFEGISSTAQLGRFSPEKGKVLYDLLFGDLLASVPENTTLILVPDEFLGILPFEALVTELPSEEKMGDGEFGPFPLGVTYLADRYLINYAQSATSLTLLRTLKKDKVQGQNMLVVADPIFSDNDSRFKQLAQVDIGEEKNNLMGAISDWKQMGVAGIREKQEDRDVSEIANALFPRLEKTEALAQEIEDLFGSRAMILSGSNAREDRVKGTDFSKCRYLTFATHGILDNTVPYIREPALVLNQVGNPDSVDGFLTMNEVMGLKLDAEVVALTACETGLGKNVSGEGVMGMGRAFQYAGARDVLVSLWSVAETSATELTAAFFRSVKEGHEPKEAIRLARNEIRRKGYEHPFYWASFVMYGN